MELLTFVKANWTFLGGVGAVLAAAIGWTVTYAGWRQVHKNNEALERQKFESNLKLEKEKFVASLNLDKRRGELKFISDQIQQLYGPLYALGRAAEIAFISFKHLHGTEQDGQFFGLPQTPQQLRVWRIWMSDVMMPLNLRMEQAITENAHLIDGASIPESFQAFLSHVASYKAVLKGWKEAEQNGSLDNLTQKDQSVLLIFQKRFTRTSKAHMCG